MHTAAFAHPAKNTEALDVAPGSVVADFGTGSGHYSLELAKAVGEEGKVYAIDMQVDLLRRLKNEAHHRHLQHIETIPGDIGQLHGTKLKSRSVDLVLMSNVLFQLEHPRRALEEARRILKHTGRLAIIDWADSPPAGRQGFVRIGPAKHHVYPRTQAFADTREAGFESAGGFAAGAHHYGLFFTPV